MSMWNDQAETSMGLSHALEAVAMPTIMDSLEQKDSNEWQELVEVLEK